LLIGRDVDDAGLLGAQLTRRHRSALTPALGSLLDQTACRRSDVLLEVAVQWIF
jgi:hypothetical protein